MEEPKVVVGSNVMIGDGTTKGALAEFPVSSVALTMYVPSGTSGTKNMAGNHNIPKEPATDVTIPP